MTANTHVTFIHGIANKPPPAQLRRIWLEALAEPRDANTGFDLEAEGVSASFVYWADLFHEQPIPPTEYESIEDELAAGAIDTPELEEDAWMRAMRERFPVDDADNYPEPRVDARTPAYERIPLPWFVKKRIMRRFLVEAHDYLFNVDGVRDVIRQRVIDDLNAFDGERHILAGHSQGSIIAYDVLNDASGCKPIQGLMTLGSPLGVDEIQDRLVHSREDGFPERLHGDWVNVYDPADLVARLDPRLANDFKKAGKEAISDIPESNWGSWRHSASKYLKGGKLRHALRALCNREE